MIDITILRNYEYNISCVYDIQKIEKILSLIENINIKIFHSNRYFIHKNEGIHIWGAHKFLVWFEDEYSKNLFENELQKIVDK